MHATRERITKRASCKSPELSIVQFHLNSSREKQTNYISILGSSQISNQTKYDYEIATLLSNHVPVDASQPVDD